MWAVVEHAEYESAGAVRGALDAAGCRWLRVRRSVGPELPHLRGLDGLIVLGGPGPSAAAVTDPVLGPLGSPIPVLQWHREAVGVPRGGVALASSDACSLQAFRWADHVYGLQFHAEINAALGHQIQLALQPVQLSAEAVTRASQAGRAVLDRFLRLSLGQS